MDSPRHATPFGLAPALGCGQRAHIYKWLMWLTNTLQSSLIVCFYPERMLEPTAVQRVLAAEGLQAPFV